VLNNRIAIGAAQFGGFPYGVSNDGSTKVSYAEISNILTYAKSVGVNTIDTAITYGVSETRLGNFDVSDNDVITKLPEIPRNCHDISSWVEKNLEDSLVRLKLPKVYGLLVWNINDLSGSRGLELWTAMQSLKKKKLVHKIGYSIYEPKDLDIFYDSFFPDIVQTPFNILDRRLDSSGWLTRLFDAKVEIHIRSIFLQGLLLMNKTNRPFKFDRWLSLFEKYEHWLQDNNLTAMEASISFALIDPRITKVIIGVDSLYQLKEIIGSLKIKIKRFPEDLSERDSDLLNPARWSRL
jgi:aryl-alcohol dehydrogenase-like predicted oxidoreductase